MGITITTAPCCWGVDDVTNPNLPSWERVFDEVAAAGYGGLELGPYGYVPLDLKRVSEALRARGLFIVAGTIFDDLVSPANREDLLRQTDEICALVSQLPQPAPGAGQRYADALPDGHGLGPRRARLCRRPFRPRAAAFGCGLGRDGRQHPRHRRREPEATACAPCCIRMPAGTSNSPTRSSASQATFPPRRSASASTPATATMPAWTRWRRCERYAATARLHPLQGHRPDGVRPGDGRAHPVLRGLRPRGDVPDRPGRHRLSGDPRGCSTASATKASSPSSRSAIRATPAAASPTSRQAATISSPSASEGASAMITEQRQTEAPIRWAMVGGGRGSQIGYIHRSAALRDRTFDLVAGAFDLDPERGRAFGDRARRGRRERCYPDYRAMFAAEAGAGRRHPGGVGRDAQQHPLRDRQGGARARAPRRLREAALLHRRRGRGARGARRGAGQDRRRDLRLRRAPADRAGPRDGRGWRARRDPPRQPAVRPRLPLELRSRRRTRRRAGASTRASPALPTCSATSARIRSTSPR